MSTNPPFSDTPVVLVDPSTRKAYDGSTPLPVALTAGPTIDIGDVTLLAGTAEVGKLGAGEAFVGQVGGPGDVIDVTLSLDTLIYADGDVLADTQAITNAVRVAAGRAVLKSVQVLDEDDQGVALDLVFLDANVSLGTENVAPSITDANARNIIAKVSVATGDFIDLGGCKLATKSALDILMKAAAASTTLYVAAITRGGTPTYTAAGLRLKLAFDWR